MRLWRWEMVSADVSDQTGGGIAWAGFFVTVDSDSNTV